jgi:hypothetical protein
VVLLEIWHVHLARRADRVAHRHPPTWKRQRIRKVESESNQSQKSTSTTV